MFQRTTRRLALTAEGRSYLARCKEVLALLADADANLQAEGGEVRGHLTITAPVMFGEQNVAAVVAAFVQQHPQVSVELLLLDRYVNLVEEGVDAAIRIGELADSTMVATRLGAVRPLVVVSPSWLKRHAAPTRPEQLRDVECISFSGERECDWVFVRDGRRLRVPVQGRLGFNHPGAALRACESGAGIGWFLSYQVRESLHNGRLKILLPELRTTSQSVQWVMPQARLVPARVRAFAEAAAKALRPVVAV